MNPYIGVLQKLPDSHSVLVLKITTIIIAGVLLLTPYVRHFKVTIGARTTIQGRTKRISDGSPWGSFLKLMACVLVFIAAAWVTMLV